jgi:hypothetical protein
MQRPADRAFGKPKTREDAVAVTATLTAPPESHLAPGRGERHRVVALGAGFGRQTATKALKHDEIPDVLPFLMRLAGGGTAHVHNHATLWIHVVPTSAAGLTVAGALVMLYAAITRGRNRKGWH